MGKLVISGGRLSSRRLSLGIPFIAAVSLLPVGALRAQETNDTLVLSSTLTVPDSVPLTFVKQLVPGADGSVFLLDARTNGVLAFDSDGAFRRRFGRRGEGPGELLSPWRLGLLGQDTLWVADSRLRRINLYDASTGANLGALGPVTVGTVGAGRRLLRPFAILADHSVVAASPGAEEELTNLLAFPGMGRQNDGRESFPLSALDFQDRLLAVPVPAGGGGLQMRNPFSHSDMLAIDPSGTHVIIVRRPHPNGSRAFFTIERRNLLERSQDSIDVPYLPRQIEARDLRAWAESLGAVQRMVEMGVFSSRAAGVAAVLGALEKPEYYPPVLNRGAGIVEEGVLIDSGGATWLGFADISRRTNEWTIVSSDGHVSRASVPLRARLLAVQGDRVWAEVRDGFGVPTVQVLRVHRPGA